MVTESAEFSETFRKNCNKIVLLDFFPNIESGWKLFITSMDTCRSDPSGIVQHFRTIRFIFLLIKLNVSYLIPDLEPV